jgi:hypothetical protein
MYRITRPIAAVIAVLALLVCGSVRPHDSPHIGLKIRTLTLELRKQIMGDAKGALVTAVNLGSAAQEKGLSLPM